MRTRTFFGLFAALPALLLVGGLTAPSAAFAQCDGCSGDIAADIKQDRENTYKQALKESDEMFKDYPDYQTASAAVAAKLQGVTQPTESDTSTGGPIQVADAAAPGNSNISLASFEGQASNGTRYFVKNTSDGVMACAVQYRAAPSAEVKATNVAYTQASAVHGVDGLLQPAVFLNNGFAETQNGAERGFEVIPVQNITAPVTQQPTQPVTQQPVQQQQQTTQQPAQSQGSTSSMQQLLSMAKSLFGGFGGSGNMLQQVCNMNKAAGACQAMSQISGAASQGLGNLGSTRKQQKLSGVGSTKEVKSAANVANDRITAVPDSQSPTACQKNGWLSGGCSTGTGVGSSAENKPKQPEPKNEVQGALTFGGMTFVNMQTLDTTGGR